MSCHMLASEAAVSSGGDVLGPTAPTAALDGQASLTTFAWHADTPGLHFHHRLMHMLPPDAVKQMHPRKPLAPYTATSPLSLAWQGEANRTDSSLGPLVSRCAEAWTEGADDDGLGWPMACR